MKKIDTFGKYIIFFYIMFLLSILTLINISYINLYASSPDEVGEKITISNLAKNHFLPIEKFSELNQKYKNVFSTRGTVVNNDGLLVPYKSLGNTYILSSYLTLIDELINVEKIFIIFHAISILIFLIYLIQAVQLFTRKVNIIDKLFLITLFFALNLYLDRIINFYSLSIFISFYYLLKWIKNNTRGYDVNLFCSSLAISTAVFIRYEFIVNLIIIFLIFCYLIIYKKKSPNILLFFLVPSVIALCILVSNNKFYDGYLNFSYSMGHKKAGPFISNISIYERIYKFLFLVGIKPINAIRNTYYYIIALFPIIFIPALINIKSIKKYPIFSITVFAICIYLITYYGSNPTFYGFQEITIISSYVRYFSPIYLFLFMFASPLYIKIFKNIPYLFKLMIIMLFTSLFIISFTTQKINDYQNNQKYTYYLKNNIKKTIPLNSTIFSNYWDKLLYNDYTVATLSNKINSLYEYFYIMKQYYLDDTNRMVYYLPKDDTEKSEFNKFLNNNSDIACTEINMLNACQLKENEK
ncbi:MAG: hypothetical protein Q8P53_04475 [Candidatus Shapirobacteria bacterium]|nr:hypothetical protein [Candidatus Shapirobacteria bacterium]